MNQAAAIHVKPDQSGRSWAGAYDNQNRLIEDEIPVATKAEVLAYADQHAVPHASISYHPRAFEEPSPGK